MTAARFKLELAVPGPHNRVVASRDRFAPMPSLVRFLTIVAVIVALVYAAMYGLVAMVKPRQGEMSEKIEIRLSPAPPAQQPAEDEQP